LSAFGVERLALSVNTGQIRAQTHDFVIPAKAAIQEHFLEIIVSGFPLSRE